MEKFKIPNTTADMPIEKIDFVVALSKMGIKEKQHLDTLSTTEVSDLNYIYFGGDPSRFDKYTSASNRKILNELILSCMMHEEGEVRPEIVVDDVKYVWQSDYSKQPVSFHRDISRIDFDKEPYAAIGFCYIEEGLTYNATDQNNNVINPRHERSEKLKKDFNLAQFLDLNAFFLESYGVFAPYLKIKEKMRNLRKTQQNGPGKIPLTT